MCGEVVAWQQSGVTWWGEQQRLALRLAGRYVGQSRNADDVGGADARPMLCLTAVCQLLLLLCRRAHRRLLPGRGVNGAVERATRDGELHHGAVDIVCKAEIGRARATAATDAEHAVCAARHAFRLRQRRRDVAGCVQ